MNTQSKLKILGGINAGFGHRFTSAFITNVKGADPDKLTDKQLLWLDKILFRYRRQYVNKTFKALLNSDEKSFIAYLNNKAKDV